MAYAAFLCYIQGRRSSLLLFSATTATTWTFILLDGRSLCLLRVWWRRCSHLEDNLECCVEHLIQSSPLLGRTDCEGLEGVNSSSLFNLFIGDALSELRLIARLLCCIAKIGLCSDKDARALPRGRFDFGYPFWAGIPKRLFWHQAKANYEAIGVCVSNRAQSTEIIVASRVPYLQLHFLALIVLSAVVCIKHCWLVQVRELFLRPGHDDRRLSDGRVAHEHKLHVMFLHLLINLWFGLYHLLMTFFYIFNIS